MVRWLVGILTVVLVVGFFVVAWLRDTGVMP